MSSPLITQAITETKNQSGISYVLNDENVFLLTSYKMLMNQTDLDFIKCCKTLHNGKVKLTYLSSGLKVFDEIIATLDSKALLIVLVNIFTAVLDVKSNGFLYYQNLDLRFDRIFVNVDTQAVKLVYLPVEALSKEVASFENNFKKELLKALLAEPTQIDTKINEICSMLSDETSTISDLQKLSYMMIDDIEVLKKNKLNGKNKGQPELIISSQDTLVPVEYRINKPEFLLGKKADAVDGLVNVSPNISRIHCKIIYQDTEYYIVDLGSLNGTFVNNEKIASHEKAQIKHGDIVSLAKSKFIIQIVGESK